MSKLQIKNLRNKETIVQFVKYVIAAGIATLFDWGSYYLLYNLFGIHYILSVVLSFVVWLVVNYVLSIMFVFKKSRHKKGKEFTLVLLISLSALVLNMLCVWAFANIFNAIPFIANNTLVVSRNLIPLFAKITASVICMVYNFILRKVFVFS